MIPMAYPVIDTNLFIRALTNDHPTRSVAAGAFLRRIERGEITVEAPVTAIADAVFVLASPRLYKLPRPQVQALLTTLVRLPHLRIASRRMVLRARALRAYHARFWRLLPGGAPPGGGRDGDLLVRPGL